MRIGIDLLWVRVGICGGTESYIRNLLDGFCQFAPEHEYVLFTARDNGDSFKHYAEHQCMRLHVCPVDCAVQLKRILWENRHLAKKAEAEQVDVMFIPVYSKPASGRSRVPYVSVIHDLQAFHYPEYFSLPRRAFLKYAWHRTCRTSDRVIAISDFVREDVIRHYPFVKDRICTVYNPIISRPSALEASFVEEKYGIRRGNYFYCVSSLLPHKNLSVILQAMKERKRQGQTETKLVLSGVGGDIRGFQEKLAEMELQDMVILTGFISDEERDCLYENCLLFLFPSVFEGFGMPPIEAMRKGKNVVMTDRTSLREVTEGRAVYVQNPFDFREWNEKIQEAEKKEAAVQAFEQYALENVVKKYINVYESVAETGKKRR